MKQYINFKVRQGGFTNMIKDFGPWVTQKTKTQAPRIIEWMNENQGADVKADIKGEPGHEGYVGKDMKFVNRDKFSRVNFAANNPGGA